MPHIIVEAPSRLAAGIPWPEVARDIHVELAASGYAKLQELKTRVTSCAAMLGGDSPGAEHLAVSLIMTNPRSTEMRQAMASVIARHLGRAAQRVSDAPVEICVFSHYVPKSRYMKQATPPAPTTG